MPDRYSAQVRLLEDVVNHLDDSDEKQQLVKTVIPKHRNNAPLIQDLTKQKNRFQHTNHKKLINTFKEQISNTFDRVTHDIVAMLEDKSDATKKKFLDTLKRDCAPRNKLDMDAFNHFLEHLTSKIGLQDEEKLTPPQR